MGNSYAQYDTVTGKLLDLSTLGFYYPAPITGNWSGWPTTGTWTSGTDAALAFGGGKVYFFSGSQYARYSLSADVMDGGYPKTLPGGWGNWPTAWTSVNAGFKRADGKVYLFRGGQYLRISSGTTVDAGYPKAISGNWGNMPFSTGVDSSVALATGKVYFLKGTQFVLFNPSTSTVEQGPSAITGRLPGVMY